MDKFFVGQTVEHIRIIDEQDIYLFASLTEDNNPIHIDENAAKQSIFKQKIAHGMFIASLISGVLGMKMPGPGTIYLQQNIKFIKPVYIGDTIKIRVKITNINEKKHAELSTNVYNQEEKIVIEGNALVKLPDENIK